jgi:DNA-binding NtrC family response regulator
VRLSVGEPDESEADDVTFVLSAASFEALEAHSWPGNVRELELFVKNAAVFSLSDALGAAERGRGVSGATRTIPIPARLVRELLSGSWAGVATEGAGPDAFSPTITPRPSLRDVTRDVERQLYTDLFRKTGGDFERMAAALLEGDPKSNARKVRLRFNQLGLKVRDLRKV